MLPRRAAPDGAVTPVQSVALLAVCAASRRGKPYHNKSICTLGVVFKINYYTGRIASYFST